MQQLLLQPAKMSPGLATQRNTFFSTGPTKAGAMTALEVSPAEAMARCLRGGWYGGCSTASHCAQPHQPGSPRPADGACLFGPANSHWLPIQRLLEVDVVFDHFVLQVIYRTERKRVKDPTNLALSLTRFTGLTCTPAEGDAAAAGAAAVRAALRCSRMVCSVLTNN